MQKLWTDDAWDDYLYWQTNDKKTLKRINQLIKDIERNGNVGNRRHSQVDILHTKRQDQNITMPYTLWGQVKSHAPETLDGEALLWG